MCLYKRMTYKALGAIFDTEVTEFSNNSILSVFQSLTVFCEMKRNITKHFFKGSRSFINFYGVISISVI